MNTDEFQARFAGEPCHCGDPDGPHMLSDHAHLAPLFARPGGDPDGDEFLADLAAIARSPDRRP